MAPKLKDFRSPARMVATLKALAEETRLRLLRVLSEGPLGVNDISERLELSAYNTSRHLKVLLQAGLVEVEKQAQSRLYRVAEGLQRELRASGNCLDLGCCTFRFDHFPK